MTRPDVTEHFICRTALGGAIPDALQAAAHLGNPRLFNALFGGFQALQKSLRQVRPFGFGKRERLVGNLLNRSSHERIVALGVRPVKNVESAEIAQLLAENRGCSRQ